MIKYAFFETNNYSSRARAFKEAGIIEQYGSGIKRIKDECKLHGVKEPKFEEFVHGFRVIIYKEKLQKNSGVVNGVVNEVYELIKNNQNLKAGQLSELSNIPLRTMQRYLKDLKDNEKVEFIGSSKTGGYFIK